MTSLQSALNSLLELAYAIHCETLRLSGGAIAQIDNTFAVRLDAPK